MRRMMNYIAAILIVAGSVLLIVYQNDLASSESTNDRLREIKRTEATTDYTPDTRPLEDFEPTEPTEPTSQTTWPVETTPVETDVFDQLRKELPTSETNSLYDLFLENDDFVGWITIPDTRIDYPIVKASDNDYYLKHDFYGQPSKAGSIFMDYRNIGNWSDQHTIIYGHKIKNKTMFYDLLRFRDPDFYRDNRILVFETLRGPIYYKVFAAYTTGPDFYFINTRFDEVSHANFIRQIRGRSDFDWDTDVDFTSKILTLATCSHDFEDSRYVVHAIRIDETPAMS